MSILQLDPPPSAYYTSPQNVTIGVPESCIRVVLTTDGSNSGIVNTIAASDKTNPPMPYLQTVQDSRGFLVIDGAFPRWYNNAWVAATSYQTLTPEHKLMANIWLTILGGGKKLLVLGDAIVGESYPVLGDNVSGFHASITGMAQALGITVTIKDRSSYGGYLNPSLAELLQYDAIVVMGSSTETMPDTMITESGAQNIATARLQNRGLYLVGDHDPYYINCINRVLKYVVKDARLEGNYDFSPGTTVGYNKAQFGNSPLFANVPDDTIVRADASNSRVLQPATQWTSLPAIIPVGQGITNIKAVIQDCDGNVTYEEYGYAVSTPPVVTLETDSTVVDAFRNGTKPTGRYSTEYWNLTRENLDGTPPGTPIWEGGDWFPTTHVEVVANGGLSTISIDTLSEFFYEIANYNLVLSSVDADYQLQVAPDINTPATRILAVALVQEQVITLSTEGRYGATPPSTITLDGLPTNFYGAGTVLLGRPDAWYSDGQGRTFPVYKNGYATSDDVALATTLYTSAYSGSDPILDYTLFHGPDSWTPLPGNPRVGGSIPGWQASPSSASDSVIPTQIIGQRDVLLAKPVGFVQMNNLYVPYW